MNKNIVIIVGNFSFPDGDAPGKRVLGLGFILKELGYEPIFIGLDRNKEDDGEKKQFPATAFEMDYYELDAPNGLLGWLNYYSPARRTIELIENIGVSRVVAVIVYGSMAISLWMKRILNFSKMHGIIAIADCVDWIQTTDKGHIATIIKYLDTNYQKRILLPRFDAVIAISRYLFDYYSKKKCRTVLIPPVADVAMYESTILSVHNSLEAQQKQKTLYYAGIPFNKSVSKNVKRHKDRLDRSIQLLYDASRIFPDFCFKIFGITRSEYLSVFPEHEGILNEMREIVVFHGKIRNSALLKEIVKCDFLILLRDDSLVTRAGFPTKISESISLGVPVITERTSNISDYIVDGQNGILLNGYLDVERVIDVLKFDSLMMRKMKDFCLTQRPFDFRKFSEQLASILPSQSR